MSDLFQLAPRRDAELSAQIQELVAGKTSRMLEPALRKLVMFLAEHRGRARAATIGDLVRFFDCSERTLKQMVKDLVEIYGLPVGAARSAPAGYFLCVTAEEIDETCQAYEREAVSLFRRIRALAGEQRMLEFHGQVPLALKKGPSGDGPGPKEAA